MKRWERNKNEFSYRIRTSSGVEVRFFHNYV
jgi:hypothetical protein